MLLQVALGGVGLQNSQALHFERVRDLHQFLASQPRSVHGKVTVVKHQTSFVLLFQFDLDLPSSTDCLTLDDLLKAEITEDFVQNERR